MCFLNCLLATREPKKLFSWQQMFKDETALLVTNYDGNKIKLNLCYCVAVRSNTNAYFCLLVLFSSPQSKTFYWACWPEFKSTHPENSLFLAEFSADFYVSTTDYIISSEIIWNKWFEISSLPWLFPLYIFCLVMHSLLKSSGSF